MPTKRIASPHVPTAWLINSDGVSNGNVSPHEAWIERGIAVHSGGQLYLKKLKRLRYGDTVFLYVSKVGVVAAGRILDDAPIVVGRAEAVSPLDDEEYHRKAVWYADLRDAPISAAELRELNVARPTSSLFEVNQGRAGLLARVDAHAEQIDLDQISTRENLSATRAQELRWARRGQGKYREELLNLWGRRCAVTGCDLDAVLRASHALPWKTSTDEQRLDPANGLPLVATIDALFDRGLIGFGDKGDMLQSRALEDRHWQLFGLPMSLRLPLTAEQKYFLAKHRELFALG